MDIPKKWTAIAYERSGLWVEYANPPISLEAAQNLLFDGTLLLAQRRCKVNMGLSHPPMEIVVKKAKKGDD